MFSFLFFSCSSFAANSNGLSVINKERHRPFVSYQNKFVLSYGSSPQNILTYLPKGNGNEIKDWVEWAEKYHINNVRSYPPSIIVAEPAENIYEKSKDNPRKFDLERFNDRYFNELRQTCLSLNKKGFIIHLQLWQAVYWKKFWGKCYYNPKNNVNPEISKHAGPGEFVTMKNPKLLYHQKKYVTKILDTTADIGNVFYDVMNEIGNGTGTSKQWVREIIKTINQWEKEHRIDVLITLNDEGGKRMGDFSLTCPSLDLIVKDLGRYDEHIETIRRYGKPTISVRNIDYDYRTKRRLYFAGGNNLEVNTDPILQARGRKYWWRMFMAGVQIAGGYADTYHYRNISWFMDRIFNKFGLRSAFSLKERPSYRLNQISERNFLYFRKFVDQIKGYENLVPSSGVIKDHSIPNSYCLHSTKQAIIYLESPNGRAGFHFDRKQAEVINLMLSDGLHDGEFYYPSSGAIEKFKIHLKAGKGKIMIPPFEDDIAILIR